MVKQVSDVPGNRKRITKVFSPILKLMFSIDLFNKDFGNIVCETSISNYDMCNYKIRNFRESIQRAEIKE